MGTPICVSGAIALRRRRRRFITSKRQHALAHVSLETIARQLFKKEVVIFDETKGEYFFA
jgi:hypothetical protein